MEFEEILPFSKPNPNRVTLAGETTPTLQKFKSSNNPKLDPIQTGDNDEFEFI